MQQLLKSKALLPILLFQITTIVFSSFSLGNTIVNKLELFSSTQKILTNTKNKISEKNSFKNNIALLKSLQNDILIEKKNHISNVNDNKQKFKYQNLIFLSQSLDSIKISSFTPKSCGTFEDTLNHGFSPKKIKPLPQVTEWLIDRLKFICK